MHETPHATLHFDVPGPGQILPAGRTKLHGWLVSKPGTHYTDLRVASGSRIFPGMHGFPRRDLADFFHADKPYLLAGFEVMVELLPGPQRLVLEGCSITGAWLPIDTLNFEVTPNPAPAAEPEIAPIRATEFGGVLRILLCQLGTAGASLREITDKLLAATPRPHYLRHPHLPFHGHLDEPQAWARSIFGRVPIAGWLFHETSRIKRVFATTDLQAVQTLEFGQPTPFLAGRPGQSPQLLHCGFVGFLDLPHQLPPPVTVRTYAELDDGSWHMGSVARIAVTDHEFAKQPLAPFSALTFLRAWRTLRTAMKSAGFTIESGAAYRKEVGKVWREYRTQAPRPARSVSRPARLSSTPGKLERLHLCTHNLNYEGAPLFLLEYARCLRRETGCSLAVTSGREGPLRSEFESLGAIVQVVDTTTLQAAPDSRCLRRALQELAKAVDLGAANLVVANTLSAYWGVHLARRAGRPVLFYIHESTTPRSFFHGHMAAATVPVVEESFRLADRVSFLTPATQRYYAGLSDGSNYGINPGWIDLAGIDRFRGAQPAAQSRAQLGLAPGKRLVVNIGSVCDRKGQHLFARAVDLLWRFAPELAAQAEFRMVGGRDTAYDLTLADFLTELGRANLQVVPETRNVYPYYQAADLFVCSSYEESFPRVVLEAMAFERPIVTTNVHGIPEIVRPDQEALLVAPGDSAALAAAMQRLLASPADGEALAKRARQRVAAEFDGPVVLPRHLALARSLA